MSSSNTPRPTLGQALLVLFPGLIVMMVSMGGAMAGFQNVGTDVPLMPMFGLFIGAALFAVGAMMLLVVMVRPFFAQRTADKLVEQTRAPTIER